MEINRRECDSFYFFSWFYCASKWTGKLASLIVYECDFSRHCYSSVCWQFTSFLQCTCDILLYKGLLPLLFDFLWDFQLLCCTYYSSLGCCSLKLSGLCPCVTGDEGCSLAGTNGSSATCNCSGSFTPCNTVAVPTPFSLLLIQEATVLPGSKEGSNRAVFNVTNTRLGTFSLRILLSCTSC